MFSKNYLYFYENFIMESKFKKLLSYSIIANVILLLFLIISVYFNFAKGVVDNIETNSIIENSQKEKDSLRWVILGYKAQRIDFERIDSLKDIELIKLRAKHNAATTIIINRNNSIKKLTNEDKNYYIINYLDNYIIE